MRRTSRFDCLSALHMGEPHNARGTWATVAIAGAGALSAGSGLLQGGASRTGQNEARDLYGQNANQGVLNLGQLLYGPGFGTNYSYGLSGGMGGQAGGAAGGGSPLGAGGPGSNWQVGPNGQPIAGANWGGMDKYTVRSMFPTDAQGNRSYSGGSLLGQLSGIANQAQGANAQTLAGYGADTSRLSGLAQGAEGMARQWGQGQGDMIRGDFGRQLKSTNQQTQAGLAAAGFGNSTIGANQMSQNATANSREQSRALQELGNQQIQQQEGARTQRLNVEGARASGQTGLQQSITGQNAALQRAPLDVMLQAQMSSIMNPWLNQNATSYTGANSGAANALGSVGNALGGYGGFQLGQDSQKSLLQQLGQYGRMGPFQQT